MRRRARRVAGLAIIAVLAGAAAGASGLAVNAPERQFSDYVFAPPMPPRIVDEAGTWRLPFVYPLRLENRLERTFTEDRSEPMALRLLAGGSLVAAEGAPGVPWFPLGTDGLGRDVLARVLAGARTSLGVAVTGMAGALLIGALLGAVAGLTGGRTDEVLMRLSDFLIALPALYVVLALRAAAPLVLSATQIFWIMAGVFAVVGWPFAARGVRAIVATERRREYAEAARAMGATSTRLLIHHLIPATRGFLVVQATLLLPAFIVAEATLSFAGLGFGEPTSSWGVMLQEAGRGNTLVDAPWLLAPAGAIVLLVFAVNLVAGEAGVAPFRARASGKSLY
jgi:peptide/nickel transport system permease protein